MMLLQTIAAGAVFMSAATAFAAPESAARSDQLTNVLLCAAGERQIFHATSTEDEFGYAIAVCEGASASDEAAPVAVILSGEGGNLRTECAANDCDGVIEFSRYTRYRFTQLTLKWRDKYAKHRLTETFDAQDFEAEPSHSLIHYWGTDGEGEALATANDPLSLMQLQRSLLPD
ncbi:hypothetical protein [Erythrobacter sp. MTPC3]|uniref:hypothetical protein n=1 Tax=Erythrobacter sp. MTPC3 TaxID=3056564 RepID=UPI0036F2A70B